MRVKCAVGAVVILTMTGCEVNPTMHLGFPGPATVESFEASTPFHGHEVEFTVYYPTDLKAPVPLVVFNTGWNQPRSTNAGYCLQLAQWGYVVINRQYPSFLFTTFIDRHIEHASTVIDWALAQNDHPGSPLHGRIDPTRVGVTGYSLGAAVAIMTPLSDARIRTCVALDPIPQRESDFGSVDYVKQLAVPALFIKSGVPSILGHTLPLYEHTPPPCMQVTVEGASHMQFEDDIVGLNVLGKLIFPGEDADPDVTRGLAVKYMVAWFKVYLDGDPSFLRYVLGPDSGLDERDGLVTISRNLAH